MSAQPTVELTGARWSSACHCPRRAYYDHVDAPKAPPSEQMKRWWRRGKAVEAAIRGAIFEDIREQGRRPRAEEPIPWPARDPIGTGHLDAWIPSEHHAIEIKSNGAAQLTEAAALQVAGYALNIGRAEHATVIAVDSNSFDERWWPIDFRGLEPRVREIEETVVKAITDNEPAPRVCRHPGDSPSFLCPYAETICFDGYERPDPDVLLLDEEAVVLAELTDDVARLSRDLDVAKVARDHQREVLRPYLEPGVEVRTDHLAKLQRTEIPGRRSLSLSTMEKAGVRVPEQLEPFVTVGQPSERWTVRRRA